MEAYFRDDARIQDWLDKIIEKLFTVCLLTGEDAESEFARGRQAVEKIASLLLEISPLNQAVLTDGIHQLVEQRLPDPRIMENFPQFYKVLDQMILSGVAQFYNNDPSLLLQSGPTDSSLEHAYSPQLNKTDKNTDLPEQITVPFSDQLSLSGSVQYTYANPETTENSPHDNSDFSEKYICFASNIVPESPNLTPQDAHISPTFSWANVKEVPEIKSRIILAGGYEPIQSNGTNTAQISIRKHLLEAQAAIPSQAQQTHSGTIPSQAQQTHSAVSNIEVSGRNNIKLQQPSNKAEAVKTKIVRSSQIPPQAERLALVLKQLFPTSQVRWNVNIGKYTFLAQVENLLVLQNNADATQTIENEMKKQGWVVFTCNYEDLAFPRRLERGIRQLLRNLRNSSGLKK